MRSRVSPGYLGVIAAAFFLALGGGWTNLAERIDGSAYDWMFRLQPPKPWPAESVVVAFDEESLAAMSGMRNVRRELAAVLRALEPAQPSTVAIDVILADASEEEQDAALEQAFAHTRNLVLASDLVPGADRWEDPIPRFRAKAAAVGHVHAAPDPVSRVLPLEKAAGHERRWAVALEALRLHTGAGQIEESPESVLVGSTRIPAHREDARAIAIRYQRAIPIVPARRVAGAAAECCRGKAVFIGVTAQSAARDRLLTPYEQMMSGVEIHAQAFETMRSGRFLRRAPDLAVVLTCLGLVASAAAVFALLGGWGAYAAGALLIASAHLIPHAAFARGIVFPYVAPVGSAWMAVVFAAAWQHFVVRRQLRKSESDRARYQQAIHFVTHEMRSPLTAIQGSSEMMGRYALSEEKRKQMAGMIHSESKRLARMIQTFLDIERLTDGHMELRSDPIDVREMIAGCVARAQPLAARKQIAIDIDGIDPVTLRGDLELMEYAVYNLLTNAVKYSPAETRVTVSAARSGRELRLAVGDQGIGMDEKELRNIFRKFYRTRKAEASGEAGTGIGLSIVEQIVARHEGRIEVASTPGQGSCFTIVLPIGAMAPQGAKP